MTSYQIRALNQADRYECGIAGNASYDTEVGDRILYSTEARAEAELLRLAAAMDRDPDSLVVVERDLPADEGY